MGPRLLRETRRFVGDDDAEDIVQEVLLRLWQMVGDIQLPPDGLASVLIRNLCIDQRHRERCTHDRQFETPLDAAPAENDERVDRMMAIIEGLPALQQTILCLRHKEGLEMKAISVIIKFIPHFFPELPLFVGHNV